LEHASESSYGNRRLAHGVGYLLLDFSQIRTFDEGERRAGCGPNATCDYTASNFCFPSDKHPDFLCAGPCRDPGRAQPGGHLAGPRKLPGWNPLGGLINFAPNSYFQMGAQGVTTASGTWRLDPPSRNLALDGQHVLYGAPLQFHCALGPASQADDTWSGQCRDSTGVGTIQLSRY
jgi:hypothetical protein